MRVTGQFWCHQVSRNQDFSTVVPELSSGACCAEGRSSIAPEVKKASLEVCEDKSRLEGTFRAVLTSVFNDFVFSLAKRWRGTW